MTSSVARSRGSSASLEAATLAAEAKREWQFPELTISSGVHSHTLLPDQQATVLLPVDSALTLLQGKVEQILRPPYDLLFLPAGGRPERLGTFRGLAIQIDPVRLCRAASELSSFRLSTRRCHQRLHDLRVFRARQQSDRDLILALHQILQILTLPGVEHNNMLALIGLELPVYRNLALILCSDLIQKGRNRAGQLQSNKVHIIDDLLEWIQANLDRPIQLHDLEERSGYSQRSLRNMFQDRFGCGPIHWIRSQRLEAARARLLEPQQNDTVSTIAIAHGYQHLSQFSRDFQASYGIKPSEVLREGLRGQP